MSYNLDDIAKVLRTPLELNGKPGDKIFVITDTRMDPVLWQGLLKAANDLQMEPAIGIMNPLVTHSSNPVSSIHRAALDPELDLIIYLTSTAMAHATITEDLVAANKRFILMEELTPAMLSPDGPAGADYEAMNEVGQRIAKVFTRGRHLQRHLPERHQPHREHQGPARPFDRGHAGPACSRTAAAAARSRTAKRMSARSRAPATARWFSI